jgi:predicted metal-binding membrane protein
MAHAHAVGAIGLGPLTLMWFGMMAAMMAPTVWPWVRVFHRFADDAASSVAATARFAAGYLVAWLAYSMAAAFVQRTFQTGIAGERALAVLPVRLDAAVFLAAGLYQFAPLKRACLTHCRSPLSYFLARWRNGPAGGFRMGLGHGVYCLGCCWALMATMLVVGAMNAWWLAALASVTWVEQVAPYGAALRRPIGVALVAVAIWRLSVAA